MARHRKPLRARLAASMMDLARAAGLVTRADSGGKHASAATDLAVLAAATITNPIVPETVDDIDPGRQPAELPSGATTAARDAVNAVHTDFPGLRDRVTVTWTFHDDGAHGAVSQNPDFSDDDRRGVVAAYAAALGVRPDERARDDGSATVSAAGQHPAFPDVKIGIEATCCRDVEEPLEAFERAVADLAADWPCVRDRRTITVPAARPRLALPAAREAT